MQKRRLLAIRGLFLVSSLFVVMLSTLANMGTVAAHPQGSANDKSCYRTRIGLNGTKITSWQCLLKEKPVAGKVSPYIINQGTCSPSDTQLFEDSSYGAAELCLYLQGVIGSANLATYPVNLFINWDNRVSSYKTGLYAMKLTSDPNGQGTPYSVRDNVLCSWIGSVWNDRASWIQLTRGDDNVQEFC